MSEGNGKKSPLHAEAEACAKLASLPVQQAHAAGIDVGDATHWVCVDADGGDAAIREFPAHTPGLRDLVVWMRQGGVTTVALEATGAYGHVLFLKKEEAAYAEQVRERLERQLHRRAKELGYELKKIDPPLQTGTMPDGDVFTVKLDGEIVPA
jgi:hypothetical protein